MSGGCRNRIEFAMISNTEKGKQFQLRARAALEALIGERLEIEVSLPIGTPPQMHDFDVVSRDRSLVCECKAFTWTETGKIPSAKITTLREAATYLSQLPVGTRTILIMLRDVHPRRNEALADYFARLNRHLIGNLCIMELGGDNALRTVCGRIRTASEAGA